MVPYHWRFRRRGKTGKYGKVGVRESDGFWLSLPILLKERVTQGGTRGIGHPTWRRTQGTGMLKGWDDKRDQGCIPDTFT